MGETAGKIASFSIITTDNPRTEKPEQIVAEIEQGIKKTKGQYECIIDRVEAIKAALKMANAKDIVVIAGKGHEQYQEIDHKRHPFDERKIVEDLVEQLIKEGKKIKKEQ